MIPLAAREAPTLSLLFALFLTAAGCAHVVPAGVVAPGAPSFDLRAPGCEAAPRPPATEGEDVVDLRYLSTSGLYVSWRGHALLTSPFFSRAGPLAVGLKRMQRDEAAIERGLAGLDLGRVGAILVGHGHFDHLLDVPPIALEHTPRARIYANETAVHQLAAYGDLQGRTKSLEDHLGHWVNLTDAEGAKLPFRVLPMASSHARQSPVLHWAPGSWDEPWEEEWTGKRYWKLREGQPLALLIDLLGEGGETLFRIFYQESASHEGTGLVPGWVVDSGPIDLAVLCMASFHLAEGYPEYLLRYMGPEHVLVTHYEDFFRSAEKPPRFVFPLTRGRVATFLGRLGAGLEANPEARPANEVCGPSNEMYTLPLAGEWLRFRAGQNNEDVGERMPR